MSGCGLILLNKKPGLTSFESLNILKKALSTGKVGHTGTLDKFASGLLLALAGNAGKLASLFADCRKTYRGSILFGTETDTLDPEGKIIAEAAAPPREKVESVLRNFRGDIFQAPPAYSAVHINGVRAHELSRMGKEPEMKKRPVIIYELELLSWQPPCAEIHVCCSSGTYIRSLARDIALAAGSRAHLCALERTRIGNFTLEEAFDPQKYADLTVTEALVKAIRPVNPGIFKSLDLPVANANDEQIRSINHGQSLESPILKNLTANLPAARAAGVFTDSGRLAAVLECQNNKWNYGHVFPQM